jgi:asparagine synthase (glutamine-hydrolysing)
VCGIAGFSGADNPAVLQAMADALAHRGPDGSGFLHSDANRVSLAHRRLAILDIAGGDQPMWNEDGSVGIVFNGEIYNHADLRPLLERAGHRFRSSHSDTEVLVHGYEEWGESMLERLNGMFSFCIYDRARRQLFFARDRFGKKPLYYAQISGGIAFASELKALLKHPLVPAEIDTLALRRYFAYGFIPAPASLYRGVSKLPGGCWMRFDVASSELRKGQYYRFSVAPDDALARAPDGEVEEELLARLSAATARRLVADRPVGIFLSGGLDSSAILACASAHAPVHRLRTFSIGFHEKSFDESADARLVAEHFGTDHLEEILDISAARDIAGEVVGRLDEPMGDSSILPTHLLARFARRHVVVALSGDGGDELLAGYAPFRALGPANAYCRLVPRALRGLIRRAADALPSAERYMSLDFKIKRTLRGLAYPASAWNPAWLGPLEPKEIADLLEEPAPWDLVYGDAIEAWEKSDAPDLVGKTTEFYARFYLQDSVLAKVDRAAMMVGLEARAPFLDNEVVEFARRLPAALKSGAGQGKQILRRALRGKLPARILELPKKGFGIPLTAWLKNWPLPAPAAGLRHNAARLRSLHEAHTSGKKDERLFLWCWLVLQQHLAQHAHT